jgi:hypothetical protein
VQRSAVSFAWGLYYKDLTLGPKSGVGLVGDIINTGSNNNILGQRSLKVLVSNLKMIQLFISQPVILVQEHSEGVIEVDRNK